MYNSPVPWYTVVDEMSVDELSVDELSWNQNNSLNSSFFLLLLHLQTFIIIVINFTVQYSGNGKKQICFLALLQI